jgi:type VI secretion system secreted protein Hcp
MAHVDYFLKIDGIEGESADSKHKGEIQLESFSWGVTNQGSHGMGGGGGAGKAAFQDIHFTKKVDSASPKLMLACATGEHIKKAILVARKAGKEQVDFYKVTLENVLVSSYQQSGSSHGDVAPTSSFSLNYAKVEFEYKPQKDDGSLGGAIKAGYDQKAQKMV